MDSKRFRERAGARVGYAQEPRCAVRARERERTQALDGHRTNPAAPDRCALRGIVSPLGRVAARLRTQAPPTPGEHRADRSRYRIERIGITGRRRAPGTGGGPRRKDRRPVAGCTDRPDRSSGRKVRVTTDVLAVDIDTVGGTITGVDLRSYPVSNDTPDEPFRLLDDTDPRRYFIAQSGLTGAPVRAEPPHPLRVRRGRLRARRRRGFRRRSPAVALRRRCRGRAHVSGSSVTTISSTYAPRSCQRERRALERRPVRAAPAGRARERGRNLPHLHLHRRHPVGPREALREGRLLRHGEPGCRPRRRRRLGGDDPALLRRGLDTRVRRHQPLLLEEPAVRSIRHRCRGPGR